MMRVLFTLLLLTLQAVPVHAERLTVVELFTSQRCSSCPEADALLVELARTNRNLLPLAMHVTYWDRLGQADPFSLPAATQRQLDAKARLRLASVYTPQLVVDGWQQAVGFDRDAVRRAMTTAQAGAGAAVDLAITPQGSRLQVTAGSGSGRGTLILVGFDRTRVTPVGTGENSGRMLTAVNVVRSVRPLAPWNGAPVQIATARPLGERSAVLLQADSGRILGAVALP